MIKEKTVSLNEMVDYCKHLEETNGKLLTSAREQHEELMRYKSALQEIAEYCVGCQAFYIASDALGLFDEEKDDAGAEKGSVDERRKKAGPTDPVPKADRGQGGP